LAWLLTPVIARAISLLCVLLQMKFRVLGGGSIMHMGYWIW
jgi:hypothetical protein